LRSDIGAAEQHIRKLVVEQCFGLLGRVGSIVPMTALFGLCDN
jgi:hypothetical protein